MSDSVHRHGLGGVSFGHWMIHLPRLAPSSWSSPVGVVSETLCVLNVPYPLTMDSVQHNIYIMNTELSHPLNHRAYIPALQFLIARVFLPHYSLDKYYMKSAASTDRAIGSCTVLFSDCFRGVLFYPIRVISVVNAGVGAIAIWFSLWPQDVSASQNTELSIHFLSCSLLVFI
jgi:hypothetical protein